MNSGRTANHQQLRDDEITILENLIQPEITKLTQQKQGIVQLIQKDPIEYQLENFEVKINIKIKHKKSKFCGLSCLLNCSNNHIAAPNYVELKQTKMEIAQEPAGIWSQLGQAFDEMVTSFNGPYEFAGYVNCAPYFKQERIMTKNMFIWYDSRRCWIIGNDQHFSRRNGSGNLRLLTEGIPYMKHRLCLIVFVT